MREVGKSLGIPVYVFGPETHMTAICGMALGTTPIPKENNVEFATANFLLPSGQEQSSPANSRKGSLNAPQVSERQISKIEVDGVNGDMIKQAMFSNKTKAIVWGMQTRAVQVKRT